MGRGSGRGSGGGQAKLAKRNAATSRGAAQTPFRRRPTMATLPGARTCRTSGRVPFLSP
jgi:hypothetical protein